MQKPDYFEIGAEYASYRPVGTVSLLAAIEQVAAAIDFARTREVDRLLVDVTKLEGFASPSTAERYLVGEGLARAAQTSVKVALVAKAEMIDPDRFGVMVARNRGANTNVFAEEAQALRWLLDSAGT